MSHGFNRILLVGPKTSGKTILVKTLASMNSKLNGSFCTNFEILHFKDRVLCFRGRSFIFGTMINWSLMAAKGPGW